MTDIIQIILSEKSDKLNAISLAVSARYKIDPFRDYDELGGKTAIDFLMQYGKIKDFTLENLLGCGAIDSNHTDLEKGSLVNYCIEKKNFYSVRDLLLFGATLTEQSCILAANDPQINSMLVYHPGPRQKTVFDVCSQRHKDLMAVRNLILDYYDTTDASDSEPESLECAPVMLNPGERLAFRGIHFAPKYYSKDKREKVKTEMKQNVKKTIYSQSLLLDNGYAADDDVSEDDIRIRQTKREHENFFNNLKASADKKEKKIGSSQPPKSRNSIVFQSHFYRFIQVYINSYSRLFNDNAIQVDFGFSSRNNPLVSLSWSCEKASMYGLGNRFDQGLRAIYRNPHYRRSTKKPKHPNAGYVDIFIFTEQYIQSSTVDRKELYERGLIYLNSFYQYEEEAIAFSMVPAQYHQKRCMLSLPSLDRDFKKHKQYYAMHGIKSAKTLGNICSLIFNQNVGSIHHKNYQDGLKKLTELAAEGQSETIVAKLR